MARKKTRAVDPELLNKKIVELESIYGQKETARRLGVSPSTLRNYKTGKSKPQAKQLSKVNRVHGQNKKFVTEEKVERYKKNVETKQQARRKTLLANPKLIATGKWVRSQFDEAYIVANILQDTTEYVGTLDSRTVQFLNGDDIVSKRYGIPYTKGKPTTLTIYGLYNSNYNPEGDTDKMDYIASRFPVMLRKPMDLEQALEFLESKFYETTKQSGKRRLNPKQFIGFRL